MAVMLVMDGARRVGKPWKLDDAKAMVRAGQAIHHRAILFEREDSWIARKGAPLKKPQDTTAAAEDDAAAVDPIKKAESELAEEIQRGEYATRDMRARTPKKKPNK